MVKLSIITINYNNLDGLKRTIESVINQTWKEFEYIIIDGGSTDGSAEYIQENKEHFDYWVCEPDTGIYNAMNKGIRVVNGQYLLFLNSGDWLYSSVSLELIDWRKISDYDLITYKMLLYFSDKYFYEKYPPSKLSRDFFFRSTLTHQSTLMSKKLFENYGFYNENNKIVSDWEFFFICYENKAKYMQCGDIVFSVFDMYGIGSQGSDVQEIEIYNFYVSKPELMKEYIVYNSLETLNKKSKTAIFKEYMYSKMTKYLIK
jgi:glycosyltransferase involved in cell wall biosynthesis